jgi:hypothetical protein
MMYGFPLLLALMIPRTPTDASVTTELDPTIDIRYGRAPIIDGTISKGEWDDAGSVVIRVDSAAAITVRFKHDGENLYCGFVGFNNLSLLRVPEVLIDVDNDRSLVWKSDDWWFHASYTDCWSAGTYNDYSTCVEKAPTWEANNFRGVHSFKNPPPIIEMRIPFELIGLVPDSAKTIGIAFDVTDTRREWNLWPSTAQLGIPASWGTARSSDGWRKP